MNKTTLAIAAGATTTIMMLALLTLYGPDADAQADAQTQPKQAVVFEGSFATQCREDADPINMRLLTTLHSEPGYYNYETIWRSWADDDVIHTDHYGYIHLISGAIDRDSDVYTIKGLMDAGVCPPNKITFRGHCDSSWTDIIIGNETIRNPPKFQVACYGN